MNNKIVLAVLLVMFTVPFAFADNGSAPSSIVTAPVLAQAIPAPQPTLISGLVVDDSMTIHKLFQEQQLISAEDMNNVSSDVRLVPAAVVTPTELESASGKTITVEIQGRTILVIPNFSTIVIQDGNVMVNTTEVHFQDSKMIFGTTEIKVAPSFVMAKIEGREQTLTQKRESEEIRLEDSYGKAVYAHYTIEQRKLLGLFDMRARITEQYSAETGDFIKDVYPWWYNFTSAAVAPA